MMIIGKNGKYSRSLYEVRVIYIVLKATGEFVDVIK